MSDTQKFVAAATVTVDALTHDIWAVWVDVNAWKNWNPGIDTVRMNGNFKQGTTISLTPSGGEQLEVVITEVAQGEYFTDETHLPFGVIRNHHRMEKVGDRVQITHEVVAEIGEEHVALFAKAIWPALQGDTSVGVLNIADLVGND